MDDARTSLVGLIGGPVALVAAVLLYGAAVRPLVITTTLRVSATMAVRTAFTLGFAAAAGAVVALAVRRGVYGGLVAGALALATFPGSGMPPLNRHGFASTLFVLIAAVAGVEFALRRRGWLVRVLRGAPGRRAAALGLLSVGLVLWLQGLSRSTREMRRLVADPVGAAMLVVLAAAVLAAVAGAAWLRWERGVVAPVAVAGLWLAAALAGFAIHGPLFWGGFHSLNIGVAPPYPDTLLQAPTLLAGCVVAYAVETILRR